MSAEPPPIDGVRRSFVEANGVRFHVTESGPDDGRPVLALHGWPQHHYEWRDLLARTRRPGCASSRLTCPATAGPGPPPHRWAKEDVATDVLALLDALGLDRVLLVAHDWGAYVGYRMVLRAAGAVRRLPGDEHGPPVAVAAHRAAASVEVLITRCRWPRSGYPLQRHTKFVEKRDPSASGPTWIPRRARCSPSGSAIPCARGQAGTPTARS